MDYIAISNNEVVGTNSNSVNPSTIQFEKKEEYYLTRAQFEARKNNGTLVPGSIYHITDDPTAQDIIDGVETAKKAEQDSNGEVISSTYRRIDDSYSSSEIDEIIGGDAEDSILNLIEKEKQERTEADNTLQQNINTEELERQTTDNEILTQINKSVINNIDINYDGDNVTLNSHLINIHTDKISTETDQLNLATTSTAGLMSSTDYNTIRNLVDRVENLEGKATRLLYTDKSDPTAEDIHNFVVGLGYESPFEGIQVVVSDTNHIWRYYDNEVSWKDDGLDTVQQFTNNLAGIIKGSTIDGRVYAESDGTGSVSGWSELKNRVTDNEVNIQQNIQDIDSLELNSATKAELQSETDARIQADETKVDKITTTTNTKAYVTTVDGQSSLDVLNSATADTIPVRDSNGNIQVGNAINDNDAVNKAYVDTYGGKIDTISVNGVQQEIVDKNVDIDVPTALSELSEDENHKLVTLEEKTKLQNLSNSLLAYKTFDVGQTYNKFELVNYYDRIIISKIDNNIGNYPTLQPTDPNWLFLSFYSEQLPIKSVSDKLFILGSSTPSTSGNEAVYKEGNCYILDGKVYDKDGVLANSSDVEELGNEVNQTTNNLTNEIRAREQADTNLQTQINDKASLSGGNTFEETQTFNKDIVVKGNISDGINNVLVSEILKSNITNTFSAEQIFNDNIILKDGYGIKSRLSTGALKNIIYKDGSGSSIIIGDTSVDIITNGKSFLPMTNIDLGSTALKWRNVYLSGNLNDGTNSIAVADIAKKSEVVDLTSDQTIGGTKNFTSNIVLDNNIALQGKNTSGGAEQLLKMSMNTIQLGNSARSTDVYSPIVKPAVDNAKDLGSSSQRWRNVYVSGNLSDGTNNIALSNIFTTNTEQDINVSKGFNALTRFTSINILGNKSDGTKIRRGSISGENGDNGLLNFDISNGLRISSLSNSSSSWILKITSDGSLEFSKG